MESKRKKGVVKQILMRIIVSISLLNYNNGFSTSTIKHRTSIPDTPQNILLHNRKRRGVKNTLKYSSVFSRSNIEKEEEEKKLYYQNPSLHDQHHSFNGSSGGSIAHSSSDLVILNATTVADTPSHRSPENLGVGMISDITVMDRAIIMSSLIASIVAAYSLMTIAGPGSWRYFAAGGICAAFSHAVTTPIDVIKTRQQVDKKLKGMGFVPAAIELIKKEGTGTLLAGLGPTAFGYLIEGATKFGIYEVMKPAVKYMLQVMAPPSLNSKFLNFIICGTVSGAAASIMLCPMEALRIRLVAQPSLAQDGWIKAGYSMLKNEGVSGLWKGVNAMMTKQIPYTVTKNVSFDFFAVMAYSYIKNYTTLVIDAKLKVLIPLVSAFFASMLSAISSQPGDLLLSLVNAKEGEKDMKDYIKKVLKKDGIKGFFVGMKGRFLHVGLIVTSQLLIYDFVKRLCGIPATGSM